MGAAKSPEQLDTRVRTARDSMGAGVSTDKKPLTEVKLKSEVGVLFDDKAK